MTFATKPAPTQTRNIIIATPHSVAERLLAGQRALFFGILDLGFSRLGLFGIVPRAEDVTADAYRCSTAFDGDRIVRCHAHR